MSEYQYYEFQAVDRPLSSADRRALRDVSSRARITTTSFTNSYEWGDFKGDPDELMERWFDLHLYLSNWGFHRLMIKLPARLVDQDRIRAFIGSAENVTLAKAGDNLILDIAREEVRFEYWAEEDLNWLAGMAQLRADLLAGDYRLLYLLWLMALENDEGEVGEAEPMPGIGPLTVALETFVEFFGMDIDLVQAAAERKAATPADDMAPELVREAIAAIPAGGKIDLLVQIFNGEPHVVTGLRAEVRGHLKASNVGQSIDLRTISALRARAADIRKAREDAEAEAVAAQERLRAEEAEKARQVRLDAIVCKGDGIWDELEGQIMLRNPKGYDNAATLLFDLHALAERQDTEEAFRLKLDAIRERHAGKGRFLERLVSLG